MSDDLTECPSCGGAGGGPFGRAGSAWDTEDYVCPRCRGVGKVRVGAEPPAVVRPGVVKASPPAAPERTKRRASGDGNGN
jgi:hypothetical protein